MRGVALPGLELNGDLGVVQQVGALEQDTEAALADLLAHPVVHAHHVRGGRRHLGVVSFGGLEYDCRCAGWGAREGECEVLAVEQHSLLEGGTGESGSAGQHDSGRSRCHITCCTTSLHQHNRSRLRYV